MIGKCVLSTECCINETDLTKYVNRCFQVVKRHGSFIDWLTSTNEMSSKGSMEFTSATHKVIGDKLRSQMKSVKPLPVSKVVRDLIKEPGFISEVELKRLFKKHPDFEMIVSGNSVEEVKVVKEKMPTKAHSLIHFGNEEDIKIPYNTLTNAGGFKFLRKWFTQVLQARPKVTEQILLSHGCFLRYLVRRSNGASPDDVVENFPSMLQSKLNSYAINRIETNGSPMKLEKLLEIFAAGFVDSDFLLESLKTNWPKIQISDGFVKLLSRKQPQVNNLFVAKQGLLHTVSDNADTLDSLSRSISKILSSKESSETCFERLDKAFAASSPKLMAETFGKKSSYWKFLVTDVPNCTKFEPIVHHMVKKLLGTETKALRTMHHRLFLNKHLVMPLKVLEKSLKAARVFVLERFPPNRTAVCVKRTGANNEPIFYNDCEKRAIVFIMSYFKDGCFRTKFELLFNFASFSRILSADLHTMLFDISSVLENNTYAVKDEMIRAAMFRRFLRMFPTVFTVEGDVVELNPRAHHEIASSGDKLGNDEVNQNNCSNIEKVIEFPEATSDPSASNTGCVCSNDDDETDPPMSSESLQKVENRCQNVNAARLNVVQHRTKKRDCQNSNTETSVLSDKLEAISENLIQHVTMGRLLMCDDREMSLDALLESLIDVLMEDENSRTKLKDNRLALRAFQSRFRDVLLRMAEKDLLKLGETGSFGKVKLVLTHTSSASGGQPDDAPLAVFRRISCVTRISNSKMRKYIFTVASLYRKPVSLNILFVLVKHKFASRKILPNTSDDLLQCQVVSCLKSDSKFVLNPEEQTFCFSTTCRKTSPTLKSYQCGVQEKEISRFIVGVLKVGCALRCSPQFCCDYLCMC